MEPKSPAVDEDRDPLGIFGKYLTVWVALAGGLGVCIGHFAPEVTDALDEVTIKQISMPVTVLIWLMVYPMVIKIDMTSIKAVRLNLKPIMVTTGVNYLLQPFFMYGYARLFFDVVFKNEIDDPVLSDEYIAGSVILGGSPCTAMVFVWSFLTHGDPAYTLVQVAVNDILIFIFYIPTLMLLLSTTDLPLPWDTAFLAVGLFMVVPGVAAYGTRWYAFKYRDQAWLDRIVARLAPVTMAALIATIVLIFIFQGKEIVDNPVHVLLIAVPLTLQTFTIFVIAYGTFYLLRIPHKFAAPGALIATSNFFELAVAVAMSLYGAGSGATLATVVGVLTEVPTMLFLVHFANRTKRHFDQRAGVEKGILPAMAPDKHKGVDTDDGAENANHNILRFSEYVPNESPVKISFV